MGFLRCLWHACSGFRTYQNFLNLSLQTVLGYWITFSALVAMVFTGAAFYWLETGFPLIEKFADRLPPFSITNGTVYSSLSQPWVGNTNYFPIILDLEQQIKNPEKIYPNGLLIQKKEFQFWTEGSKPMVYLWRGFEDGRVDAAYLDKYRIIVIHWTPGIWAFIWLLVVCMGLLQAFFFTLLAGLLERSLTPSFAFSQLFNISLFAIIPPAIIVTTYMVLGLREIRMDLLYFSVYSLFLIMASGSCRTLLGKPDGKETDEE